MAPLSKAVIAHFLTLASKNRFYHIQAFCSSGLASTYSTGRRSSSFASKQLYPNKVVVNKCIVTKTNFIPASSSSSSFAMKSTIDDSNNIITSDSFSTYLTSTLAEEIQNLDNKSRNNNEKTKKDTKKKELNFIMGNQAGDADSIISSLALSYVKKLEQIKKNGQEEEESNVLPTFLPIVCIEKEDLALRRDVTLLLQMAGITNHDSLVFLNDASFKSIVLNEEESQQPPVQKSFTLVDHNKIRSELWQFESAVTEIYDHHLDEGFHLDSCQTREVAFENKKATVGSTCTIVTEKIINAYSEDKEGTLDGGLGLALLGVILLDTMNMNPDAAKGTPRDGDAIQFLLDNSDWDTLDSENMNNIILTDNTDGPLKPDRVKLYEYLRDSKFDRTFWQEMSARDALRIDYKRFEPNSSPGGSFGLSSVLLDSSMVLSKPNFYRSAIDYMKEVGVDVLGVLCMVIVDDTPQREMIMIGKPDTMESLTKFLQNDTSAANLEVTVAAEDNEEGNYMDGFVMRRFNQGNPKGSRKQIAPVLMDFFSKL